MLYRLKTTLGEHSAEGALPKKHLEGLNYKFTHIDNCAFSLRSPFCCDDLFRSIVVVSCLTSHFLEYTLCLAIVGICPI